jgi:hypothetical protein
MAEPNSNERIVIFPIGWSARLYHAEPSFLQRFGRHALTGVNTGVSASSRQTRRYKLKTAD